MKFDEKLKAAVFDYYIPHREQNIRLAKWISDSRGKYPLLLTRFKDQEGKQEKWSALLEIVHSPAIAGDKEYTVDERYVVPRECEDKLVRAYQESDFDSGYEVFETRYDQME